MKDLSPKVVVDTEALDTKAAEALAELNAAKLFKIESDDDAAEFAAQAQDVARQLKEVAAADAAVCGPLEQAKKAFRKLLAPRKERLEALDAYIRGELGRWTLAKAAEQRKQMQAAAAAANAGKTQELTQALAAVQAAAPVKSVGVSIRPVWTVQVFDDTLVPRDWCTPDLTRIAKHAKLLPTDREPDPIAGVSFVLSTASRVTG